MKSRPRPQSLNSGRATSAFWRVASGSDRYGRGCALEARRSGRDPNLALPATRLNNRQAQSVEGLPVRSLITLLAGHIAVVYADQAAGSLDLKRDVIVGIGRHPTRSPLFTVDERIDLLTRISAHLPNITVEAFDGLLIDFCKDKKARVIVRGLRAATDFEYELQIAHANADLEPDVDTVFLPTRTKNGFISASLVREIASHGGDVTRYAPAVVCDALAAKFPRRAAR